MNEDQREDRSAETDLAFLKRACAVLAENFDTVQIFCTRDIGEDGTVSIRYGSGNWYARYGQVQHWLRSEDAAEEAQQFKRANDEEDEP